MSRCVALRCDAMRCGMGVVLVTRDARSVRYVDHFYEVCGSLAGGGSGRMRQTCSWSFESLARERASRGCGLAV